MVAKDQQVIQTLASHTSEKAFADCIRPRCAKRNLHQLNAACRCQAVKERSIFAIIVANQILRLNAIGCCLTYLLRHPFRIRVARHSEMNHAPRTQFDEEEDERLAEEQIHHGHKIAGP